LCVKAESEGGIVSYCFYKHHMEAVCAVWALHSVSIQTAQCTCLHIFTQIRKSVYCLSNSKNIAKIVQHRREYMTGKIHPHSQWLTVQSWIRQTNARQLLSNSLRRRC